jgi:hypothetical protein
MRYVLRLHFEDALRTVEQVHSIAEQLKTAADQVSETTRAILAQSKPLTLLSRTNSAGSSVDRSNVEPKSFDRVWKLGGEEDDQEVLKFCSWSVLLLHLMIHKAFCVLYHALFRDPSLVSNIQLRQRFQLLDPLSLRPVLTIPTVLSYMLRPSSNSSFECAMILLLSLSTGCIRGLTNLSKLCHYFSQTFSNVQTVMRPRSREVSSIASLISIK